MLTYEPCRREQAMEDGSSEFKDLPSSRTTAITVASGTLSFLVFQFCRIGHRWVLIRTSLVHSQPLNQANSRRLCTKWKVSGLGRGRHHPLQGIRSTETLRLVCSRCSNTFTNLSTVLMVIFWERRREHNGHKLCACTHIHTYTCYTCP